jgi:hypothetical protein
MIFATRTAVSSGVQHTGFFVIRSLQFFMAFLMQSGGRNGAEIASFHSLEGKMPEKKTIEKARQAAREGKSPTTQAGEFVHEEIEHIREGKHGARSAKQAFAIGLSKARRAGVKLPPPKKGTASEETRAQAKRDTAKGSRGRTSRPSAKRSAATKRALKREPRSTVSTKSLSKQTKQAAARRRSTKKAA